MSDKIGEAARWSRQLREKRCTTPGHEDRHAAWLKERDDGSGAMRWVCDDCHRNP